MALQYQPLLSSPGKGYTCLFHDEYESDESSSAVKVSKIVFPGCHGKAGHANYPVGLRLDLCNWTTGCTLDAIVTDCSTGRIKVLCKVGDRYCTKLFHLGEQKTARWVAAQHTAGPGSSDNVTAGEHATITVEYSRESCNLKEGLPHVSRDLGLCKQASKGVPEDACGGCEGDKELPQASQQDGCPVMAPFLKMSVGDTVAWFTSSGQMVDAAIIDLSMSKARIGYFKGSRFYLKTVSLSDLTRGREFSFDCQGSVGVQQPLAFPLLFIFLYVQRVAVPNGGTHIGAVES